MFQQCLKGVSRKFQENVQDVSKKFCVAWHSSQLSKQQERLLFYNKFDVVEGILDNSIANILEILTEQIH